jgi:disulfide bond formation protein DsbB
MNFLRPSLYVAFSVILAAAALLLVFVAQYGFGLKPCPLCLYQRLPYFAILLVGLVAGFGSKGQSTIIFLVLMALWAASLILAGYHAGVEAGLWTFPACASSSQGAGSIAELEAMIRQATVTPCDQPAFLLAGLTMADMNMALSGVMVFWGFWVFRGTKNAP